MLFSSSFACHFYHSRQQKAEEFLHNLDLDVHNPVCCFTLPAVYQKARPEFSNGKKYCKCLPASIPRNEADKFSVLKTLCALSFQEIWVMFLTMLQKP